MRGKTKKTVQAFAWPGWRTVVLVVFVIVLGVLMVACGSLRVGIYKVRLQDVACDPPAPFSDMMFSTAEQPDGTTWYTYENAYLKVTWELTNTRFGLVLQNKTTDSLVVFWEEAAYINQNNDTLRVIHDGIDFFEKDRQQLPTVLKPLESVSDFLIPEANIHYDPDNFTLWRINHLFYEGKKDIGLKVFIELPLGIMGTDTKYRFIFLVEDWNRT